VQTPSLSACQSTRLCKWCNEPFYHKQVRVKYCSRRCYDRGSRGNKLNETRCRICGKQTRQLSAGGTCSAKCKAQQTGKRRRHQHPKLPCLKCHGLIGVKSKQSARLLRVSHKVVYENRRLLGFRVLTRAEANRSRAIQEGNARPDQWGKRDPSTIEEWQAWALDLDRRNWKWKTANACWSRDPETKAAIALAKYYANHEENKKKRADYAKKRYYKYKHTAEFKLRQIMRNVISRIARKTKSKKSRKTNEYLGCTFQEARGWIEKQFRRGMSWENHGKWEIHHKIPLAEWDLTDPQQLVRATHFTNLQPLWRQENRSIGARLVGQHQMALL
jgi:hypothetical protein